MKFEIKITKKGYNRVDVGCPNCGSSGYVYFNKNKVVKADTGFRQVTTRPSLRNIKNRIECIFCETEFEIIIK